MLGAVKGASGVYWVAGRDCRYSDQKGYRGIIGYWGF